MPKPAFLNSTYSKYLLNWYTIYMKVRVYNAYAIMVIFSSAHNGKLIDFNAIFD